MKATQYEKLQRVSALAKNLKGVLDIIEGITTLEKETATTVWERALVVIDELQNDLSGENLLGVRQISQHIGALSTMVEQFDRILYDIYEYVESLELYIRDTIAHDEMKNHPLVHKYMESLKWLS